MINKILFLLRFLVTTFGLIIFSFSLFESVEHLFFYEKTNGVVESIEHYEKIKKKGKRLYGDFEHNHVIQFRNSLDKIIKCKINTTDDKLSQGQKITIYYNDKSNVFTECHTEKDTKISFWLSLLMEIMIGLFIFIKIRKWIKKRKNTPTTNL